MLQGSKKANAVFLDDLAPQLIETLELSYSLIFLRPFLFFSGDDCLFQLVGEVFRSYEDILARLQFDVCRENLCEVMHVDERADLIVVEDVDDMDLHGMVLFFRALTVSIR